MQTKINTEQSAASQLNFNYFIYKTLSFYLFVEIFDWLEGLLMPGVDDFIVVMSYIGNLIEVIDNCGETEM